MNHRESCTMLLVFLHGRADDKDAHHDFVSKLAMKYHAQVLALNAPFKDEDGYSWFAKEMIAGKQYADKAQLNHSIGVIMAAIHDHGYAPEDVMICGHSQGGCMAVTLAMRYPFKGVISICGDLPYHIDYVVEKHPCKHIVWVEGGSDTFLNAYRKVSHVILTDREIPFHYILSPETQHTTFSANLIAEITIHNDSNA